MSDSYLALDAEMGPFMRGRGAVRDTVPCLLVLVIDDEFRAAYEGADRQQVPA